MLALVVSLGGADEKKSIWEAKMVFRSTEAPNKDVTEEERRERATPEEEITNSFRIGCGSREY